MEALDTLDRRILYELDLNARIPVGRLAKKLRHSRERVDYRIKGLLRRGIIRKFVTMINPRKLNYSIYKLYFKFSNLSKDMEQQVISDLVKNHYIYWVATAKGRWDLNITVFAHDINQFDQIMSPFMHKYGEYIADQEFNTTLKVGILSKGWVNPAYEERNIAYVGGEKMDMRIDQTDVEILRILANNARIRSIDLAREVGSTSRAVLYRIKKLEQSGIILGYTTSLDLEKLHMQFFKIVVRMAPIYEKTKKRIINFCLNNPNVGFVIFCVGSWPLELELIVEDNQKFYEIIDELRVAFPELKGYDTIMLPTEYKFDWMPLCYEVQK